MYLNEGNLLVEFRQVSLPKIGIWPVATKAPHTHPYTHTHTHTPNTLTDTQLLQLQLPGQDMDSSTLGGNVEWEIRRRLRCNQ